jgi:hypothetical protein
MWKQIQPIAVDAAHAFVQHWPTIDVDTHDGEAKHVLCHCGDLYFYVADWLDHAIVETSRDTRKKVA